MEEKNIDQSFPFLRGGGEMGKLTCEHDWSGTSIGSIEKWSFSLRSQVALMLNSPLPTLIFWGNEAITFYNDAFRKGFGFYGTHQSYLGKKANDIWARSWPIVGPIIKEVTNEGEAVSLKDQEWPVFEYDSVGYAYQEYCFIPINDDDNWVNGVFVICSGTIIEADKSQQMQESQQNLLALFEESPVAIATLDSDDELTFQTANPFYASLVGRTPEQIVGLPLLEALPELEGQGFDTILKNVIATATPFVKNEMPAELIKNGKRQIIYVNVDYQPRRDAVGAVNGILVIATDITPQVLTRKAIEESEARLRTIIEKTPVATAVYYGRELLIEVANDVMIEYWQKGKKVLGKPYREAVPELVGQGYFEMLDEIFNTGKEHHAKGSRADIVVDGITKTYYFDYSYTPLFDDNGQVYAVLNMGNDVTEQVLARQQKEESEAHLQLLRDTVPAMIFYLDAEQRYQSCNGVFMDWFNTSASEVIGKTVKDFIGEAAYKKIYPHLLLAYSGKPERYELFAPSRMGEERWLGIVYTPHIDEKGNVMGVIVHATDITQSKQTEIALRESEARFRSLIEEAPVATCLFVGEEMRVAIINSKMVEAWGKDMSVLNKPLVEALPELIGQPFLNILEDVHASGITYEAKAAPVMLVLDGKLDTYYYDFTYKPVLDETGKVWGIIDVSVDVTEQVLAARKLEESEMKLRGIISSAPAGIGLFVGRDLIIENPNQTFIDIVGKGPEIIGLPLREAMPELIAEGQPFLKILDDVFTTGVPFHSPGSLVKIVQDGILKDNYYNITYTPVLDAEGKVYAILDIAVDVTAQIKAQQKTEEAEKILSGAIEGAGLATWAINVQTGQVNYSHRFMEWLGFIDDTKPLDEAYIPLPDHFRETVPNAIENAIASKDGIYDNEHPIVNRITGQRRIIHAQAQVFYDNEENPIVLRGTAQDITLQQQQQLALENEVKARTEELDQAMAALRATNKQLEESNSQLLHSNDELAQYAYVASHDLQEPLRKIRIFTGMLKDRKGTIEQTNATVEKISKSAERMSMLISDLLEYSRLLNSEILMRPVDLNDVLDAVLVDFELSLEEKGATINIEKLPILEAVNLQMNQLINNLIGNALKFTAEDVKPQITITSKLLLQDEVNDFIKVPLVFANYYHISFSDNGIGFEQQYAEQIFDVFKRLHGQETFAGSGIGLSLCRRIVANHHGRLFAESTPGKGSTFHIILPDRQQSGS